MTDNQQAPDAEPTTNEDAPQEQTQDAPESTLSHEQGEPAPTDAPPPDDDNPNREAAKYRHRLRDTEAERDQLRSALTNMRKREVERLAATHLASGKDVWLTDGLTVDSVLDDAGDVDPGKVAAACRDALKSRPHWGRRSPSARGLHSGSMGSGSPGGNTWTNAFKQKSKP